MSKEYREREEAREATLKEGSQLTHKKGPAKTPKPKIKPAPQKAQSGKFVESHVYKALKHKVTGEWGKRDSDFNLKIVSSSEPDLISAKIPDKIYSIYHNADDYELVTVELREVPVCENCDGSGKINDYSTPDEKITRCSDCSGTGIMREVVIWNGEKIVEDIVDVISFQSPDLTNKDIAKEIVIYCTGAKLILREVGEVDREKLKRDILQHIWKQLRFKNSDVIDCVMKRLTELNIIQK